MVRPTSLRCLIAACFGIGASGCHLVFGLDKLTYEDGGAGGTGGGGGTGGAPPECIPSGTNSSIGEDCGVFVSASAGEDGNGTKDKPYATLSAALASSNGKPIYACAASEALDEAVAIEDAATLFGGLDCATWTFVPGSKTSWIAPAGEVVAIVKVGSSFRVEDFAIEARDATVLPPDTFATGMSSIAIVAETSSMLELVRCDVTAGNGGDGASGETPSGAGTPGTAGQNGADGCDNDMGEFPGNGGNLVCEGLDVSGGKGGLGSTDTSGGAGSPGQPFGDGGKGGLGQTGAACTVGGDGAAGTEGAAGAGAAASALGTLSAAGFVGVRGGDGAAGTGGQGAGGGGGAKVCSNGKAGPSGAGGGSGGCAGLGGKGGYPGGASIGIASLNATLKLSDVKVTSKNGGQGGAGGAGQPGGPGGNGGMPGMGDGTGAACSGGKGGNGGSGGKGGGGLGGHSIGIAHTGDAPDVSGATITKGTAGMGGLGDGDLGTGGPGVAAEVQSF